MLAYRIALAKYSGGLVASGRAARWNPNDIKMIYSASSRSLACLENVVHRDKIGLSQLFNLITIEYPDSTKIKTFSLEDLPADWREFNQMAHTQRIGELWVKNQESALLEVPSSIVEGESNFLINPGHKDFELIKIIKNQPFVFDSRIKQ